MAATAWSSTHEIVRITESDALGPNEVQRYGDADVFLVYSRDRGETWSSPERVNDDTIRNGKDQFFTWMAVDPVDGSVNVVFYDRRDIDGARTGLTMARSVDGGVGFVNYPLDQDTFEGNADVFFGDYIGIDAFDGRVVAAYMHFISENKLALSSALFTFRPGTHDIPE